MWDAILDGTIYSGPSMLASFVVLSYADLKKFRFHYHYAFPALQSQPTWDIVPGQTITKLTSAQSTSLCEKLSTWRYSVDTRQHGFFLVKRIEGEKMDGGWKVGALADYERGFFDAKEGEIIEEKLVGFTDPSTELENPGWPLRNLLVLVRKRWGLRNVRILCFKETHTTRDQARSYILPLRENGSGEDIADAVGAMSLGRAAVGRELP